MFYRLTSRILGGFDVIIWTLYAITLAFYLLWASNYWNPKFVLYLVAAWIYGVAILYLLCVYFIFCSITLIISTMGTPQDFTASKIDDCKMWQGSSWALSALAILRLFLFFRDGDYDCCRVLLYVVFPVLRIVAPFCVYKYIKELKLVHQNSGNITQAWTPLPFPVTRDLTNSNETRVVRFAKQLLNRNNDSRNSCSASFDGEREL